MTPSSTAIKIWKKITHDDSNLQIVKGIKLDLTEIPQQRKIPHNLKLSERDESLTPFGEIQLAALNETELAISSCKNLEDLYYDETIR